MRGPGWVQSQCSSGYLGLRGEVPRPPTGLCCAPQDDAAREEILLTPEYCNIRRLKKIGAGVRAAWKKKKKGNPWTGSLEGPAGSGATAHMVKTLKQGSTHNY